MFGLFVLGGTFSFLAYVFLFSDCGYLARGRLSRQISLLEREIATFEEQNENLEEDIKALKNDPEVIERIARESLGLIKEGEIKYKSVPEDYSSP